METDCNPNWKSVLLSFVMTSDEFCSEETKLSSSDDDEEEEEEEEMVNVVYTLEGA